MKKYLIIYGCNDQFNYNTIIVNGALITYANI